MTIHLTPRQREIVAGICAGLSYAEIARALSRQGHPITCNTVRAHVVRIGLVIVEPPELPPRHRIFLWAKHEEWARTMGAKLRLVA